MMTVAKAKMIVESDLLAYQVRLQFANFVNEVCQNCSPTVEAEVKRLFVEASKNLDTVVSILVKP